jgi:hypothetical protein
MPRRQYTLDTDDKRLIDDAKHAVAGGSIRKLAKALHRSEPYLRHVLAGRAKSLDDATRKRLQHLIVRELVRSRLMREDERWATRAAVVMDHVLTCPDCLIDVVLGKGDRHFKQTVVDRYRNR